MKFTCQVPDFQDAISTSVRAIAARPASPILEGVLLEAVDGPDTGGFVRLTCADASLVVISQAAADVREEGRIVLPGKLLAEYVRKLPSDELSFSSDENYRSTLKCASSRSVLMGAAPEAFVKLPDMNEDGQTCKEITFSQRELKNALSRALFSVAAEEDRPVLTGCLLELDEASPENPGKQGGATLVALDGYRLAIRRIPLYLPEEPDGKEDGKEKDNGETERTESAPASLNEIRAAQVLDTLLNGTTPAFSAVIPGKALEEVQRSLADLNEPVTLMLNRTHALISLGATRYIARLLDGEFIRYRQILPRESQTQVILPMTALASAIERASLIAREGKNNLLKLHLDAEMLVITANSEQASIQEEIYGIQMTGKPLDIAFNATYLMDLLKVLDDDAMEMRFQGALSPCLVCPLQGDAFLYLILPVRVYTA